MKYNLSDKMKEDIRYWWKTNMPDCNMDKKIANTFRRLVVHEIIHCKIVKKSAVNIDITLQLERVEEKGIIRFYYGGVCKYNYPYKFNLPKYYPKFISIQFKNFLFDVICDIFGLDIFTNFRYILFKFLKCLISFKVRN